MADADGSRAGGPGQYRRPSTMADVVVEVMQHPKHNLRASALTTWVAALPCGSGCGLTVSLRLSCARQSWACAIFGPGHEPVRTPCSGQAHVIAELRAHAVPAVHPRRSYEGPWVGAVVAVVVTPTAPAAHAKK